MKIMKRGTFGLLAALTIAMLGCEVTIVETVTTYDLSGSLVNIKDEGSSYKGGGDATLAGAQITFESVFSDTTYTTTVDSRGQYSIENILPGRYRITGTQSGWTFVPMTYDVTSSSQSVAPDILAYPEEDPSNITIVMSWDNMNYDIDLVATYGPANDINTRGTVNFEDISHTGSDGYNITLDRDVRLSDSLSVPRVETITVTSTADDYPNHTRDDEEVEQLRFYAHAYAYGEPATGTDGDTEAADGGLTGATDLDTEPAFVTMHAMLGNDHFGTWYAPIETLERTIHFINVDLWMDSTAKSGDRKQATIFSAGNYGNGVFRSAF